MLHRKLSTAEAEAFRQTARSNYQPLSPINGTWHPVYQAECAVINAEASSLQLEVTYQPGDN